jgi:uncharacterized protein YkwD
VQRTERGLPPLLENARLNASAQAWTNTMVATGDFSHGSDFAARITRAGFIWSTAGENIAGGYLTPTEVVDAWMASEGHCQNILNPGYADVGIGVSTEQVAHSPVGPATWTSDFGLPLGQPAPSTDVGPMDGCPYAG